MVENAPRHMVSHRVLGHWRSHFMLDWSFLSSPRDLASPFPCHPSLHVLHRLLRMVSIELPEKQEQS